MIKAAKAEVEQIERQISRWSSTAEQPRRNPIESSAVSVQTWTGTRPRVAATHSVKPTREGFSDLATATSRRVP